jgi:hypothetical protein
MTLMYSVCVWYNCVELPTLKLTHMVCIIHMLNQVENLV